MNGATFDAGMLVALDGNEREAWVVLRRLVNRGEVPTVPTVVTAQAWRDGRGRAQLARALGDCRPDTLSDEAAREAGGLCRRSQTADIVEAVVIESAGRRNDDVYTGARDAELRSGPTEWPSPHADPARRLIGRVRHRWPANIAPCPGAML